jgi:hypothetical protein
MMSKLADGVDDCIVEAGSCLRGAEPLLVWLDVGKIQRVG